VAEEDDYERNERKNALEHSDLRQVD
jgi:hypothetical protein